MNADLFRSGDVDLASINGQSISKGSFIVILKINVSFVNVSSLLAKNFSLERSNLDPPAKQSFGPYKFLQHSE